MYILMLTTFYPKVIGQIVQYSVIQYVLQWPPTYCQTSGYTCKPGPPEHFLIHGFWPADAKGQSIPCKYKNSGSERADVDRVKSSDPSLKKILRVIWKNLKDGVPDEELWKHEWLNHECCNTNSLSTEQYFRAAERVYDTQFKKNREQIDYLIDGGIRPSNHIPYSKTTIIGALFFGVIKFETCPQQGKKFVRGCGGNPNDNNIYLPTFQSWWSMVLSYLRTMKSSITVLEEIYMKEMDLSKIQPRSIIWKLGSNISPRIALHGRISAEATSWLYALK